MLRALLKTVLAQNSLAVLLKINSCCCVLIFLLLELWRPRFFLSDDNLSGGYPCLTEMGRHLQAGQSPFFSEYLFGGHYDWTRDMGYLCWHPFYILPALLADTCAKTWMMDAIAFPYLQLTTIGFTILSYELRKEFKLAICDGWLVFYTLSFVFSMYILTVGSAWLCFLGNQSALPWLTLGIMNRQVTRGVLIVAVVTIHQFVSSYAGMTLSNSFFLTLFAVGLAICRRSPTPLFSWCAGNAVAYLILSPFLLQVLNGFGHSLRSGGLSLDMAVIFAVPATTFPFSFFLGNWTEPLTIAAGDPMLTSLNFPYLSSLLPCAAAWCLVPALANRAKWQPMEKLCLALAIFIMVLIIRPEAINGAVKNIPLLRSMRWPFREILQFLFFIHLLLILRPPVPNVAVRRLVAGYSLAMFLLPLPFIRVPSFNVLALDRQVVLSGDGDRYWNQVRNLLKPGDQIATVIDSKTWQANPAFIPYTCLGTANFPALYRLHCITGYSTTSPIDQLPLKTIPYFWFGAFGPDQVNSILNERPDLKLLVLESVTPLRISLCAQGKPPIDLTPYLPASVKQPR